MKKSSSKGRLSQSRENANTVAAPSPEREAYHRPYFEAAMEDRRRSPERQIVYEHALDRLDHLYPRSNPHRVGGVRLDTDFCYRRLSPERREAEMLYHKLSPERSPGKYGLDRFGKENNDPYLQFVHKSADVYNY